MKGTQKCLINSPNLRIPVIRPCFIINQTKDSNKNL